MKEGEREQVYQSLKAKIEILIKNTEYSLECLMIDFDTFGNVIVVLSCEEQLTRFIQDRGDIYADKKHRDSDRWLPQRLALSHLDASRSGYESLLTSIRKTLRLAEGQ